MSSHTDYETTHDRLMKVEAERDALAAELTDASHELVTSVSALATAMARAKALESDRDQISLTLDVAKADRDKWFNRARDLEKALDWALDHTKGPETEPVALTTILNESRERIRSTLETPVQHECRCVNTCRKDGLRPSEYCREDRLTAQLAPETFVEHCKHGNGEDCPECAQIRAARTSRDRGSK